MSSLGSTVAFDALVSGDLDVYVDYSGTIWATIMKRGAPPDDRAVVIDEVSRYLLEEHAFTQSPITKCEVVEAHHLGDGLQDQRAGR